MSTEGVSSRRVAHQDVHPPVEHSSPRKPIDDAMRALFDRIERSYDAGIIAAARAATPAANTDILYVGLNPESERAETGALAKTGHVKTVGLGPTVNGVSYDFGSTTDVYRFVDSLHLDPRVTGNIADALLRTAPFNRPMLAQIAVALADGERGGSVPSRLVISAHSGGADFFGMSAFSAEDLQRLAKAMPRAAAQIQDIHLSACSTSGQCGLDDTRKGWLEAFPKLKTMWAYAGYSSRSPTRDLEAWGRATNHPHEVIDVPRDLKNHHIATWSAKAGYHDDISLTDLRRHQAEADTRFAGFLAGKFEGKSYREEAMVDYQAYRVLSQRRDVPPSERAVFAKRADALLRVRFYNEGVRMEFAKRHGEACNEAFAALGMPRFDFATKSRAEALSTIADFEKKLASAKPVPANAAAAASILRGLRDLDTSMILESDCRHLGGQ